MTNRASSFECEPDMTEPVFFPMSMTPTAGEIAGWVDGTVAPGGGSPTLMGPMVTDVAAVGSPLPGCRIGSDCEPSSTFRYQPTLKW